MTRFSGDVCSIVMYRVKTKKFYMQMKCWSFVSVSLWVCVSSVSESTPLSFIPPLMAPLAFRGLRGGPRARRTTWRRTLKSRSASHRSFCLQSEDEDTGSERVLETQAGTAEQRRFNKGSSKSAGSRTWALLAPNTAMISQYYSRETESEIGISENSACFFPQPQNMQNEIFPCCMCTWTD